MDLPPFKVQVSPLPHIDTLHHQSRHNIKFSISYESEAKGHDSVPPLGVCSLILLLHFLSYLHCKTMAPPTWCSHLRACIEGSITTNKASGGDGIPVELFQILKEDAAKVLHSTCQQIWETQQWPQDWKRSVFIPIPNKAMPKNAQTTAQLHSSHTVGK